MATTTFGASHATATSLRDRLAARIATARTAWSQYRTYRATLTELGALTNRDLADLGISRSEIRSIAMEAAYGA